MKSRILLINMSILLVFQICYGQNQITEKITIQELKAHMNFLASDSLKGRKPGTPEDRVSAEYIAGSFKASGLYLLGEKGFQYFNVITSVEARENNFFQVDSLQGKIGEDYNPLSFSQNAKLTAEGVFVGYGLDFETDSLSWHDYQNVNVLNKWAMILQGHPDDEANGEVFQEYSALRKKTLVAKDKGASGVIFVSGKSFDVKDELTKLFYDKSQAHAGIPVIHIKRHVADLLLKKCGRTTEQLEGDFGKSPKPDGFDIQQEITCHVYLIKNKTQTQNVVALLKGNDPLLNEEVIVLGAHYDHLGMGGPGSGSRQPDTLAVHNGADDNASGVVAMMEIGEKLAIHQKELKRSVLFIAFGAEEMGTIGSKYFTDHPLVDLKNVKAMINLDMVGRLDTASKSLSVGGVGTAKDLEVFVKTHLDHFDLNGSFSSEGYGPSDHAAFYANDIPVLFLMTGIHQDYHTPVDDVDKINFAGQKTVSDFVCSVIMDLAARQDALVYQEAGPKSQPRVRRRFKVTLGIMPDVAGGDIEGLRVTAVMPDRPAFKSGMKKGDVIIAIEGRKVGDIYEYMHRLSELKTGQRISVDVIRNGEKKILIVQL